MGDKGRIRRYLWHVTLLNSDRSAHRPFAVANRKQNVCCTERSLGFFLLFSYSCHFKPPPLFTNAGLLGFARLMPGDVYDVIVHYGAQKWKSRGHIGASTQTWDNDNVILKAVVADLLDVKVIGPGLFFSKILKPISEILGFHIVCIYLQVLQGDCD